MQITWGCPVFHSQQRPTIQFLQQTKFRSFLRRVFNPWLSLERNAKTKSNLRKKTSVVFQVMGSLAAEKPEHGKPLSGILIKRGFNYHLIAPDDLQSRFADIPPLNIHSRTFCPGEEGEVVVVVE